MAGEQVVVVVVVEEGLTTLEAVEVITTQEARSRRRYLELLEWITPS